MAISEIYEQQRAIARREFADIILDGQVLRLPDGTPLKLRLHLVDDSFLDVHVSPTGRYSYHWERGLIGRPDSYRFDNAPHAAWRGLETYPAHFHDGLSNTVVASHLSSDPLQAIREVCDFVRRRLWAEQA